MATQGGETLEQFLARLAMARLRVVERIVRPPILFPLRGESPYDAIAAELRAIKGSRLFRLKESIVRLRSRLRGVVGRHAAESVAAEDRRSKSIGDGWFGNYAAWVLEVDTIGADDEPFIEIAIERMAVRPRLGIVAVVSKPEILAFERLCKSLAAQHYQNFTLTVCGFGELEASDLVRIREAVGRRGLVVTSEGATDRARGLNLALQSSDSEWVMALDPSDRLPRHALFVFADVISGHPEAQVVYSDEDEIDHADRRRNPQFKPDWNELLLLEGNYFGRSWFVRRPRLSVAGGFGAEPSDGLWWDTAIRCTEGLDDEGVVHTPFVLLHRCADFAAFPMENPAVFHRRALESRGYVAGVREAAGGRFTVELHPGSEPLVSVIIPTRDHGALLRACIESIFRFTAYPNFEIVVLDNASTDPSAVEYLRELKERDRVTVVRDESPFNYSNLNNLGAYHAKGEVLALLNNDIEVTDPNWMSHLVALAVREDVGAVGALLVYPDQTIQHGGVIVGLGEMFVLHSFHMVERDAAGYQSSAERDQWVSAVTGACLFVRKVVYEQLGGLDSETFPVTYNDIDFCLKAVSVGLHNVYAGSVCLVHHESKTRGADDTLEKRRTQRRMTALFSERWGAGYRDPYYSPNLELTNPSHQLSFMPRVHKPWYR